MPKQPVVSGQEAVKALYRAGFVFDRQKGGHVILWHPERRRTATVPVHPGEDLRPGTLANILRQAGLEVEEFRKLLK